MKMESFFEASRFYSCFDRGERAVKKGGNVLRSFLRTPVALTAG